MYWENNALKILVKSHVGISEQCFFNAVFVIWIYVNAYNEC